MVGREPNFPRLVLLYRCDAVLGQSCVQVLHLLRFQVVAPEVGVGAYPQRAIILVGHADGRAIEQVVGAQHLGPAFAGNVEAGQSHGGRDVYALLVGRDGDFGDIVVDEPVLGVVPLGLLFHHEVLHLSVGRIELDEAHAHGAQPDMPVVVGHHAEDAHLVALGQWLAVEEACQGVYPSATIVEAAYPHPALLVFGHAKDGGGNHGDMPARMGSLVVDIDAVFVGSYPGAAFAVAERTEHA